MLDTRFLRWSQWSNLLRRSAAGCLSVLFLALVYVLLAGPPQPIAPASSLFAPVSVESVLADSRPALSSTDFSQRPVFAIKRMPPPPLQAVSDEPEELSVEAVATDEVASSIDGVRLLGIFGSGEVGGAIIRLDNGERQRLPVGESVNSWILQSLEPRGALFEAATGQQALLRLAFSADQSVEASPARAVSSTQSAFSEQPEGSPPNSPVAEAKVLQRFSSFGDVYRSRKTPQESGEK
jgi:hypothetical protein